MRRTWVAVAIANLLVFYLGCKVYTFTASIKAYRDETKSQWVAAPQGFLQLVAPSPKAAKKELRFFRINDVVMGGRSTSSISCARSLVFEGRINTTGGGFASCRTLGDETRLGLQRTSTALLVDAAGDNQRYKLTLHIADSWSMGTPAWSRDFVAAPERTVHRLEFADFTAARQGRPVRATLDVSKVTGIGFSLSLYDQDGAPNPDFGPGPFRLEVFGVKEVES
jgi:hypothetical protein